MTRRIKNLVMVVVLVLFAAASLPAGGLALPINEIQRKQPRKEPEKVKEREKPKRDSGDQGGGSRGRDDKKKDEKRKPDEF